MGKRGGSKSRDIRDLISKNLPFDETAEKLFLAYGMNIAFKPEGGVTLSVKEKPPPDIQRWINANKEKLITWKYNVDRKNRETRDTYNELYKDKFLIEAKDITAHKREYSVYLYKLKEEGLRLKIEKEKQDKLRYKDKEYTPSELFQKLNKKFLVTDSAFMSIKDLDYL